MARREKAGKRGIGIREEEISVGDGCVRYPSLAAVQDVFVRARDAPARAVSELQTCGNRTSSTPRPDQSGSPYGSTPNAGTSPLLARGRVSAYPVSSLRCCQVEQFLRNQEKMIVCRCFGTWS